MQKNYPWILKTPYKKIELQEDFNGMHREKKMLLFSDSQKITEKIWLEFQGVLDGSYYWTFDNPMPDDGILDGNGLSLYSMSHIPRTYTVNLIYHENHVHCPIKGSYTSAFEFLLRKSVLFKRWKINTIFERK